VAEPLKNQFGPEIPAAIGRMIAAVYPGFPEQDFLCSALDGYDPLSLTERAWKIARTLETHLPDDYAQAVEILLDSLGPKLEQTGGLGMAPFLYLPHVFFTAEYGLDHFEDSMRAQYELTQRFTAEFSIRPYLKRYPEQTLARLKTWAADPSAHVRRLVSEGTRPRLPWAPRLRQFQEDPGPVLELLELLKDDPELYVRRSVANNLNDIGKDHPELLAQTARRWLQGASPERKWLVRHALRSAVKRGDPGALAVLGYGAAAQVSVGKASISPARPHIGGAVLISVDIENSADSTQEVLVDLQVEYQKAHGRTNSKVFKMKTLQLNPGESARLSKKISLANMTTRRHYPGIHNVYLLLNGQIQLLGSFDVRQNQL
jgi:3-methyladenine DNA glycosylase AlkC